MTIRRILAALPLALALSGQAPVPAAPDPGLPSPGEIVAAAPAADWAAIAPRDLLVMTLAPAADGSPRQVVIQLLPAPFSADWVSNIRTLAADRWWDGTSINRVQDNYVVQWGDPDGEEAGKAKPLPETLQATSEAAYEQPIDARMKTALRDRLKSDEARLLAAFRQQGDAKVRAIAHAIPRDPYADETIAFDGWPIAIDRETKTGWPIHCYGMVGVGRNLSPDAGTGAELYTVIGQAPRHLDRNIALVGRVVEGMEHLSSLPRGTGALGFYERPEQRVPIRSVRLASDLPDADRLRFEYLRTESESFARYLEARANRRDAFFIRPAGGVDICNAPVPVRRIAPAVPPAR